MIFQVLTTMSYGDAVSNNTVALYHFFQAAGYESQIYAEHIHHKMNLMVHPLGELFVRIRPTDLVIYHFSTGTDLNYWFGEIACQKVLIYHNVTPPEFFVPYSNRAVKLALEGKIALQSLANKVQLCIADSNFNAEELVELGFENVQVLPIILSFEDYKKPIDMATYLKYKDGVTNLLFVGRISPNKKQEDLIESFAFYQQKFNLNSRLILAGSYNGMEAYKYKLDALVNAYGLQDKVVFTGHISFASLLALYNVCDCFVCLSEHEGFCVPLIEAMIFSKPIVARDCGAVGQTLGEGGILLSNYKPEEVAASIHSILQDDRLQNKILQSQKKEIDKYDPTGITEKMMILLQEYLQ